MASVTAAQRFRGILIRRPISSASPISQRHIRRRWWSTKKPSEPLRILYCGSDEFSCESLQALHDERSANGDLIRSIDVVTRPAKATGRGLKTLREVPLKLLADRLKIPVYERDTFTGWTPPRPFNLIIAVSFGLFVPARLLRATSYGGLNIHPSLLPDLPGASPIQHAILLSRSHTGVSLQTLDPHAFDKGTILAQAPSLPPGFPISSSDTTPSLTSVLARQGADLLIRGLREGVHVPPLRSVHQQPDVDEGEVQRAPKLTKADQQVDWTEPNLSAADVDRRARALGTLWTHMVDQGDGSARRVLLDEISVDQSVSSLGGDLDVEFLVEKSGMKESSSRRRCLTDEMGGVVVVMQDSASREETYLRIGRMTVDGKKSRPAGAAIKPFVVRPVS